MSVKITTRAVRAESLDVELKIVMNLGEWKTLAAQLGSSYPSWRLSAAIGRAITEFSRQLDSEINNEE